MKTKMICLCFCAFTYSAAFGQEKADMRINIETCYKKARENYPLIKQFNLIEQAENYTLSNISKNYMPQFGISAQATYQTDVTKLPIDEIPLPSGTIQIPSQSKDQYKIAVEVSQNIWDGNLTYSQKKITRANAEREKKFLEVNLQIIKEKVNQLFFGILSIDEQIKIIDLTKANFAESRKIAQSMLNNGAIGQADLDLLDVELLNLEQWRIEQKSIRLAFVKMLALFINEELDENAVLQRPSAENEESDGGINAEYADIKRPELNLFSSQISMLNAQKDLINSKNMPRLNLFLQGGYGRPALNMLKDDFNFFALGGVRLLWNFGGFYTEKNEIALIENNIKNIEFQRENFLLSTKIELEKYLAEIQKTKELLAKDNDIIRLRNRIKETAESKYKNGVYQTNEFIRDINSASSAEYSKALHEVQYLIALSNYRFTKGLSKGEQQ